MIPHAGSREGPVVHCPGPRASVPRSPSCKEWRARPHSALSCDVGHRPAASTCPTLSQPCQDKKSPSEAFLGGDWGCCPMSLPWTPLASAARVPGSQSWAVSVTLTVWGGLRGMSPLVRLLSLPLKSTLGGSARPLPKHFLKQ